MWKPNGRSARKEAWSCAALGSSLLLEKTTGAQEWKRAGEDEQPHDRPLADRRRESGRCASTESSPGLGWAWWLLRETDGADRAHGDLFWHKAQEKGPHTRVRSITVVAYR